MNQPVIEGDYEGLVKVMGFLMHIKDRTKVTDTMFKPIIEILKVLQFYDADVPEEVYVLLEVNVKV